MTAPLPNDTRASALAISGKLISRNSGLNLASQVVPLIAGLVCVPILISQFGTDRFGLLAIAWIIIGYFGLFEFGFGRALVRLIGHQRGLNLENSHFVELVRLKTLFMAEVYGLPEARLKLRLQFDLLDSRILSMAMSLTAFFGRIRRTLTYRHLLLRGKS